MRVKRILDATCVLLACAVLALLWIKSRTPVTVTLLDRPRGEDTERDFIRDFLDATSTEYVLDEGYVVLQGNRLVRKRLLQLLAGLQQCLSVNEENRRRLEGKEGSGLLTCLPQADGSTQVLPVGESQPAIDLDEEREQLFAQQEMVVAAIRTLDWHLPPTSIDWKLPKFLTPPDNPHQKPVGAEPELKPNLEPGPEMVLDSEEPDFEPIIESTPAETLELSEIESVNGSRQ